MPQPASAATLTNIPTSASWVTDTNRTFATYSTNVPIGHLVLQTGTNTVFEFRGTTQNRALFLDLLDIQGTGITNLTTLTNQLKLIADASSSIDIYYADVVCTNFERNVNLGFQNLAEFLNGKRLGGGTLHWVPTFNGPNTSDDVVVGASSTRMNRALRRSLVIDMDGDGIPNGRDDLPLSSGASTVRVADVSISSVDGKVGLKFQAFAGTYQVQFTDSLDKPVWRTAATYNHTSSTSRLVTVADPAPVTSDPRFYRLVYTAAQ
jgi:hypothetical protein